MRILISVENFPHFHPQTDLTNLFALFSNLYPSLENLRRLLPLRSVCPRVVSICAVHRRSRISSIMTSHCLCDDTSVWTVESILQCQKISDFFIALAYFSIPLELFYFVSCSTIFPFRWVFLQFGAFIVLCGLTHFLAVWTYAPHSFQVMLSLTILKFLTALVSFATSITLVTLIPQMLRVMVREGLLRKKTRDLGREVGRMKRREEASWYVRMLTREIRRTLDRHTILYTTLVELSKVLALHNCAIWMPDDDRGSDTRLNLTHELRGRTHSSTSIPLDDPDVADVVGDKGACVLGPHSRLRRPGETGPAAAVRMPMLRVANFKGGTPESMDTRYAVLVLVLPDGQEACGWGPHELKMVEVVADQVAVALSHAAVVEDSLRMREKLVEQNLMLERARREALMASGVRNMLQKMLGREVAMPARSVAALVSVLQREKLNSEQRSIVEPMAKLSFLLSTLASDATKGMSSLVEDGGVELELRPFNIRSFVKEVVAVSKLLCACRNVEFDFEVSKEVPEGMVGDQNRILQLVLYMIGNMLNLGELGGLLLTVCVEDCGAKGAALDPKCLPWQQTTFEEFVQIKIEVQRHDLREEKQMRTSLKNGNSGVVADNEGPTIAICRRLAQLMQGSLSIFPSSQNLGNCMNLTVRLHLKRSGVLNKLKYKDDENGTSLLNRMNILLADGDSLNQSILQRLLKDSGCHLSIVATWFQCLEILWSGGRSGGLEFQLLLIDAHLLEENINEMSSRVRKLKSGSWLVIIALVPNAEKEMRDRCLRNGVHGVVCKPVILDEIEEELDRIINQSHIVAPTSL